MKTHKWLFFEYGTQRQDTELLMQSDKLYAGKFPMRQVKKSVIIQLHKLPEPDFS